MQIVVGSTNPVKIDAAQGAFAQVFPDATLDVIGVSAESGVGDQPMSDDATLRGAHNRVDYVRTHHPDANFWVGQEGGVEQRNGSLYCFAWMAIIGRGSDGVLREGHGRTATFILPDEVATLVHQGKELGDADDIVFGRSNSKQQNGSVGILTHDRITRSDFYVPALVLALIPFMQPELTFSI